MSRDKPLFGTERIGVGKGSYPVKVLPGTFPSRERERQL